MKPSALFFCLFIVLTHSSVLSDEDSSLEDGYGLFLSGTEYDRAWTEGDLAFEDLACSVPTKITLIKAIEKDDRETLLWHLEERLHINCPILMAEHAEKLNPLQYAILLGKIDLARDIIKAGGIDVNEQSARSRNSALHFAINSERCDSIMIEALVDAGANVDLLNFNNQSPVSMAITSKDTSILKLFLRSSSLDYTDEFGNTIINMAIKFRAFDALSVMLRQPGMKINTKNFSGKAPIHNAIESKCPINILQDLLVYPGINKDLKESGTGSTALHLACKLNEKAMIDQLLFSNAIPLCLDQDGNQPRFFIPFNNELMQLTFYEAEMNRYAANKVTLIFSCSYQPHGGSFSGFSVEVMKKISSLVMRSSTVSCQNAPLKIKQIFAKRKWRLEKINNLQTMVWKYEKAGRLIDVNANHISSILDTLKSDILNTGWIKITNETYLKLRRTSLDLADGFHIPKAIIEAFKALAFEG